MARKLKSSVYAVFGTDEAEVKRAASDLASQLTPPGSGEFGTDIIDGLADNADQATTAIHRTIEAVQTLPFFGGAKLVWLKNASFFADTQTGRAAAVLEAVESLTDLLGRGLPSDVTLLISATGMDKRRAFYKTLAKVAEIEVHDGIDASRAGWEEAALAVVESRAREHGLRLTPDALELFTLLTGGDSRQIASELEKISLYASGSVEPIDSNTVRELVPLTRAGVVFELGNAVAGRKLPLALRLVRQLLDQGESAVGILLVALIPTFRNLMLAKDLMDRHHLPRPAAAFHFMNSLKRLPETATDHLPRKKDGSMNTFPLALAAMNAHRFTVTELRRMLDFCLNANLLLVTTQVDPEVILSKIIGALATGKPARSRIDKAD